MKISMVKLITNHCCLLIVGVVAVLVKLTVQDEDQDTSLVYMTDCGQGQGQVPTQSVTDTCHYVKNGVCMFNRFANFHLSMQYRVFEPANQVNAHIFATYLDRHEKNKTVEALFIPSVGYRVHPGQLYYFQMEGKTPWIKRPIRSVLVHVRLEKGDGKRTLLACGQIKAGIGE